VPQPGRLWLAAAAIFAAGAVLGAMIVAPDPPALPPSTLPAPSLSYPAQVLRVIDGDTFDARVRIWPGMEAVTRVRLRGVDANASAAGTADVGDALIALGLARRYDGGRRQSWCD
jgi:endonuclease YncB( thermonuclease family)